MPPTADPHLDRPARSARAALIELLLAVTGVAAVRPLFDASDDR